MADIAISPVNPQHVHVLRDVGIFSSTDDGATWTPSGWLTDKYITRITYDPTNSSVIYVATVQGVFKTENAGVDWMPLNNGLPIPLVIFTIEIDPADSNTLYIGTIGSIYHYEQAAEVDTDGDGVPDSTDNCTLVQNTAQRDTDGDGYGNYCDPDFDNNLVVNASDLAFFKTKFFSADSDADLNGDGVVNAADLAILKTMFFKPPGSSGLVP